MKTVFLMVFIVVGLVVSSVFAGEVLMINQGTGEVVEKSNPWRQLDAFEIEAFRNPGKEVLVWSPNHFEKVDFFHGQWIKTATNVVVYKGERIQSLAKEVREGGAIFFLWYKIFLIVGVVLAMVGVLWKDRLNSPITFLDVTTTTAFITLVAFVAVIVVTTKTSEASFVATLGAGVVASLVVATSGKDQTEAKFFLFLYIILAIVAIVV